MEENSKVITAIASEIVSIKNHLEEILQIVANNQRPAELDLPTQKEINDFGQQLIDMSLKIDKMAASQKKVSIWEIGLVIATVVVAFAFAGAVVFFKLY